MVKIGGLTIDLDAKVSRIEKDLALATRSIEKHTSRMKKTAERNMRAMSNVVTALATGAFAALTKRALDSADRIQKLGKQIGASTEFLSQMHHAVALTGGEFETFAKGMSQLNRNVVGAIEGLKTQQRAFERIGISVSDLKGLAPEQLFDRVAAAIATIQDPTVRSASAMDIFGKAGKDLIPLFSEGAAGIKAMRDEADRLGKTLSQDQADAAADANDALTRLNAGFSGLTQTLALEFAPTIEAAANFLARTIPLAVKQAQAAILILRKALVDFVGGAVRSIGNWIADFNELTGKVPKEINDAMRKAANDTARILAEQSDDYDQQIEALVASTEEYRLKLNATTTAATKTSTAIGTVGSSAGDVVPKFIDLDRVTDTVEKKFARMVKTFDGLPAIVPNVLRIWQEGMEALADVQDATTEKIHEQTEALEQQREQIENHNRAVNELARGFGDVVHAFGLPQFLNNPLLTNGVSSLFGDSNQLGRAGVIAGGFGQGGGFGASAASAFGLGQDASTGAALGGAIGGAIGVGLATAGAATTAAAVGAAAGSVVPIIGTIIGAILGAAVASLFGNDKKPRIDVVDNLVDPNGQHGSPFTRRSAFGTTIQGQQITDEFGRQGAQRVLDAIVQFDQLILDTVGNTEETIANIRNTLVGGRHGPNFETHSLFEGNFTVEEILADRFRTIIRAFDGTTQAFVLQFSGVTQQVKALGAVRQAQLAIDANPIEHFAERVELANRTVLEVLRDEADALTELGDSAFNSIDSMDAFGQGVLRFSDLVLNQLATFEDARRAVAAVTTSTIENLRFQTLDQDGQFNFLTVRAEQLASGLSDLTDATRIAETVGNINQLISQAFQIGTPEQRQELLPQFEQFLQSAEESATDRINVLDEQVRAIAEEQRQLDREVFDNFAAQLGGSVGEFNIGAGSIVDASHRFHGGSALISQAANQLGASVDAITDGLRGAEVNGRG